MMKLLVAAAALACMSLATTAFAQQDKSVEAAKASATAWLALSDAGKFGDSWSAAASLMRDQIGKAEWEKAVGAVRPPLGAVKQRVLQSAVYATDLPGAPRGEYVVMQYATDFANKEKATETITPMKEKDGSWKVSGYFIR